MQKWEHGELVLTVRSLTWHAARGGRSELRGLNAIEQLNKLGQEGWQVAGVSEGAYEGGGIVRYVLSRQVE